MSRWLLAALLLCACTAALLLATADGAHRMHASKPKVKRQHNTVVVTNNNGLNQGIDFRPPNPVRQMLDEHYGKKAAERLEKREANERARKDARDLNEQGWKRESAQILAGIDPSNKKAAAASANPTAGAAQLAASTATPAGQQLPVTPTPQQQQQQQQEAVQQLQEEAARDEEQLKPKKNVLEDEGANMGEEPELKDLPPPAEPPSLDNLAGENIENPSKESGQNEQQQATAQEGGQTDQEQQQQPEQSEQEQAPKKKKKNKNKNKNKKRQQQEDQQQQQQQEGGDQSSTQQSPQASGGDHEETPEQQREPFLGTFSLPELPPELRQQPPPPGTVWQKPNAQWQPVQDNLPEPPAA